jgi:glyoxylase-like metal-dependent hydrolase (beta-lactamase superfamily II)
MSTWTRPIALTCVTLWLAGCSSVSQKQLAQDAVTAMGGAEKLMAIQTLTLTGGKGTRTRVGQSSEPTGKDVVGQLANDTEVVDIANERAYSDYDIMVGDFMQHRHEVLTKNDAGKPIGLESIDGVTFVTTPGGLFSWGTQNSPEWMLKRNPVSIVLSALESGSAADAAQEESFDGKMMKHGHAKTHDGEDVGLYFDPETKLLAGFEVLDTETMLGDVTAQYSLSDYKDVGGVKLPHHIKIRKGGEDYSDIQYASIAINDAKAANAFGIPKEFAAYTASAGSEKDYFPMSLEKVTNGVYQARAFRHHSLVVEFPTFVAVVEAPYLETQTRMLAKTIASQFPNKPIKYVAVTHHHFDHTGGIRAAAALGATILVEKRHEAAIKKILDAKHTHPRDDLESARETKKAVGAIETYDGMKTIKDGNQTLELHAFKSSHVDPMVMAYVPNGGVQFQSDLWFPKTGAPASPETVEMDNAIKAAKLKVTTMVGGHGLIGPYAEMTKAIAAMKK